MKFQEDPQFWSNLRTCVIWCCLLSEWEMVHSSVLKRKGVEQQFLCWKYRALPYKICPDRPWGPPSLLLYNGYRVTPEGKAVGAWRWPSSAEVKRRIELHLYSPSGPSWPVLEWTFFFLQNTTAQTTRRSGFVYPSTGLTSQEARILELSKWQPLEAVTPYNKL